MVVIGNRKKDNNTCNYMNKIYKRIVKYDKHNENHLQDVKDELLVEKELLDPPPKKLPLFWLLISAKPEITYYKYC